MRESSSTATYLPIYLMMVLHNNKQESLVEQKQSLVKSVGAGGEIEWERSDIRCERNECFVTYKTMWWWCGQGSVLAAAILVNSRSSSFHLQPSPTYGCHSFYALLIRALLLCCVSAVVALIEILHYQEEE